MILDTHIIIEKVLHFFSSNIKLSEKNIIFDDKKVKKSDFYKKQKIIQDRLNWCWQNISFKKGTIWYK